MLSLVPRDAERIDTNAPGGLDALLWYMRRLYHFGAIVSEPLIHSQFSFEFRWRPPTQLSTTKPLRALHPSFTTSTQMHLRLRRPLVSHDLTMSSGVWLASTSSDGHVQSPDVPLVVVKFIQPSLMDCPSLEEMPDSEAPGDWDQHVSPDYLARREAAAYDLLQDLQGSVIPYFFGKDLVSAVSSDGLTPPHHDCIVDHHSQCRTCLGPRHRVYTGGFSPESSPNR